ncbi:MAG: thioredoxin family protein [Candidatus Sericytochromatia bacterium]
MKNPMSLALMTTALVVLGLGAMSLAPRMGGSPVNQAPAQDLEAQKAPDMTQQAPIKTAVDWQTYDNGLNQARTGKKYVLVQFFATWCGFCRKMDKEVFSDQKVLSKMHEHFVPIRVTESSENKVSYKGASVTEKQLTAMNGISGFPTLVFMDDQGKTIGKIPGYIPPEEMNGIMEFITSESYKKMDYATYKQKSQKS